jgi:hypothetical protein
MAKQLIGSNLNLYGNNGQFETDRSTWGFGDTGFTAVRSATQKTSGLYSALVTKSSTGTTLLIPYLFPATLGKLYLIRAKIRVPSGTPVASGAVEITMESSLDNLLFDMTVLESVNKTVTEATDTWVEIEMAVERTGSLIGPNIGGHIRVDGSPTLNGQIYVDDVRIHEYIEVEDPDPDPDPDPNPYEIDQVYHSKNPVTLPKSATTGWEAVDNYRLYNEVRVEDEADSEVFNTKLRVDLHPDEDGDAIFYLSEAFRNVFSFNTPSQMENEIVRLTDRIKRFRNYSGELAETATTTETLTESLNNLVLWGGVSKQKYPGLNYFSAYLPTNKKFLTWAPLKKEVDRLQEDYLNFWVYDEFVTLKLQLKVYFDDGTNVTDIVKEKSGTKFTELYQIPAGPANSGALLVDPEKNVTHYELTLLNQDDEVISETRTYYIAKVRHPLTRFFMFLNSLGAYEVLRFTGIANTKANVMREPIQRFLPHDYAAEDGEFAINSASLEENTSYSSGFIKDYQARDWHEYLKDFLLSPKIFNVTNGTRLPVILLSSEHNTEDQNYERFIRFEAKPAYIDESFTPEEI